MANPMTIIAMIQPVAQPFDAEAARLNGRRKIIRPPAKSRTPMTRRSMSVIYSADLPRMFHYVREILMIDLLSNSTAT